jgi:3-methylcrotonyl-CoA carboxylase alpha subunit
LPLVQNNIRFEGHAIEARVYAEDPEHGFLPSTGQIVAVDWPSGIRVDSGVESGDAVPPFYDPMIAKLVARAPTRAAALERLAKALDATAIAGVRTNVPFLASLCRAAAFRDGKVDTGFIDRSLAALGAIPREPDSAAAALGAASLLEGRWDATTEAENAAAEDYSPWSTSDGFQLGGARDVALPLVVDGEDAEARISYGKDGASLTVAGVAPASDGRVFFSAEDAFVLRAGRQTRVRIKDFSASSMQAAGGDNVIKAPMHGRVLAVLAAIGERVVFGQRLAVIEAMKMEHTLRAPFAGIVRELSVSTGAQVVEGAPIMVLEPVKTSASEAI